MAEEASLKLNDSEALRQQVCELEAVVEALKVANSTRDDEIQRLKAANQEAVGLAKEREAHRCRELEERIVELVKQLEAAKVQKQKYLYRNGARSVKSLLRVLEDQLSAQLNFIGSHPDAESSRSLPVRVKLQDFLKNVVEAYKLEFKEWLDAAAVMEASSSPPSPTIKAPPKKRQRPPQSEKPPAPPKKRRAPKKMASEECIQALHFPPPEGKKESE